MELTAETPSVLQIASMFASLSAQHRRVAFAKGDGASTGSSGRRSIEGAGDTFRAMNANAITSTTKSAIFYSDRITDNGNGGRTRSRSSDSRPTCLDLKVVDNKTKFDHAKALFESLERQSRQEQRQRTPHNSKKRVASPSPTRSSSSIRSEATQQLAAVEPSATSNNNINGGTVIRAGPPALRTVTIAKRDQQIRPGNTPDSCVVASETATFVAMNSGGCSTTTITSMSRLVSASSHNSSSSPNTAPPPVPPKPKFVDSPRTSSESSSAVSSPSQIAGKTRAWTLDATHTTSQRNGASGNDKLPAQASKEDVTPVAEDRGLFRPSSDNASSDMMDKAVSKSEVTGKGNVRSYFTRITQQRRVETENGNGVASWSSSSGKASGDAPRLSHADEAKPAEKAFSTVSSAISVNTTSNASSPPPDIVSPQKPSSLYEPYWRSHRFGRQRLANGEASAHERSLSPPLACNLPNESSTSQINPKRNYMLKTCGGDSGSAGLEPVHTLVQTKHDPGKLDITWPPPANANTTTVKSPTDENKDSGVGTDSPSTSTTDSRASSSMNAVPPAPLSNLASSTSTTTTARVEDECGNVAFMTKEEASVLLSPTTRDVVLRETRGRVAGDDGEVRSLPSHLSIPQDVDLKRLSMCSMDSSSEHGGLATDRYSIPDDINVNVLPDGHFWVEVAGLEDEPPPSPSESSHYKKPSRVKFSCAPIKVYSTYTGIEYDRRNDDVDPVSASAEYELERRLEKMDIVEVELQKGAEGLGFSIIGMGVGADAGLEKLGIFVKSITPGGALHRDGRVCVCDQIVEVDGKSLVGVSQNYAASVLRSTSGTVRFKIGREKDLENSEIAALIRQSLEQDRIMREQEEIFQRRFNGNGSGSGNTESVSSVEMQETPRDQQDGLPPYYQYNSYLLAPPDRPYAWNNHRSHDSPLPSTDSVFAHDDDDETPEQLVDSNPHIERLMTQLREPANAQATIEGKGRAEQARVPENGAKRSSLTGESSKDDRCTDLAKSDRRDSSDATIPAPEAVATVNSACTVESLANTKSTSTLPAFRDSHGPSSNGGTQSTYTAAEDISRLLGESAHSDDLETRFPSNGSEPETLYNSGVQSSFSTCQSQKTVVTVPAPSAIGQLRRTTPDLTSSTDSLNGSEIQLRINSLEAELTDIREETDKYQGLLNDSKAQYDNLEKKYSRAKKLIKDYQDREKDLLDREEAHLRELREKDQQYANLVKMLKDKVVELEKQLQDAHRKRASIVEASAAAAAAAAAASAISSSTSTSISSPTASDISPALAYLPAKKLESSMPSDNVAKAATYVKLPATAPIVRNVPIIVQTSLAYEIDGMKKLYGSDFGVPETELLDSTAAKCKAEVVKQSQIMAARALPTRRKETEVFIMCHHTLEHAHALRSGAHCGSGNCNNATASPCIGHADCSLSSASTKSTGSPSKSSSTSSTGSPLTPRRLTARAALLLRKKAAVNSASSAPTTCPQNRHLETHATMAGVGGGDLEKVPAVLTWTCDDVCRFLKSIALEKYTPEFSINRIDGCKLLQLDGSKLKAMGVQNHSDRALIKKQIKDMKAQIERERKQLEKESRRLHKLEKEKRQHSVKS